MLHGWLLNAQHHLMDYFHLHPVASVFITLAIAFIEALPILGTVVPGSIMMTAIGALVGSGIVPAIPIILGASVGAFIGDCLGFSVGVHYQNNYREVWPFKKYQRWLDRSEAFFDKHGGKSVIIGRFIGPARSTVPMVAGLFKMPWVRFVSAAVPSALVWAIAYMLPGILLGAFALEIPVKQMPTFIVYGIIIIALIWFIIWLCQRSFSWVSTVTYAGVDRLWQWLQHHHFRYGLTSLIENKRNPLDSKQPMLFLLGVFLLLVFIALLFLVIFHTPMGGLNHPVYYLLQSLRLTNIDQLFIIITAWGVSQVVALMALCVVVGLCVARQGRLLVFFIGNLVVSAGISYIVKWSVYSMRPEVMLAYTQESSFPSGHTVLAVAMFGFCAYITMQLVPSLSRRVSYAVSSIAIVCVMVSRLYLGAHWVTDVIASLMLGLGVLFLSVMLYRRHAMLRVTESITRIWCITLLSGLLIAPIAMVSVRYHAMATVYQPQVQTITLSMSAWWQQPLSDVPVARRNRFGALVQPFNLQWADSLAHIRQQLEAQGWLVVDREDASTTESDLPAHMRSQRILPPLYKNHPSVLTAVKKLSGHDGSVELNLWVSFVELTDPKTPLWLGNISHSEKTHRVLRPSTRTTQLVRVTDPALTDIMDNNDAEQIDVPDSLLTKKLLSLDWDGNVVVLRAR